MGGIRDLVWVSYMTMNVLGRNVEEYEEAGCIYGLQDRKSDIDYQVSMI
jgi:hypothetical protein